MKIINIDDVKRAAFDAGFDRFAGVDPVDPEEFDLSYFTESAEYANTILPRLRQFAGYEDGGYGTYTDPADTLVVTDDDVDELASDAGWIDAQMRYSPHLFGDILDAWHEGVYEAVEVAANRRQPVE